MVAYNAYHVINTTHREWHPSTEEVDALNKRAEQLWPASLPFFVQNREHWVNALTTVRNTNGGWVLDKDSSPRTYY